MQKIHGAHQSRVVDSQRARLRVKPDGSGGRMLDGVKMSVNPFDENALEEALRIKERGTNIEVVAVTHRHSRYSAAAAHGVGHGRR